MEDFEIILNVARIENVSLCAIESSFDLTNKDNNYEIYNFNPLTDKALCFDLMVRHKISFEEIYSIYDGSSEGFIATWLDGEYYKERHDKNPQRAICLAIIAKHEGQQ